MLEQMRGVGEGDKERLFTAQMASLSLSYSQLRVSSENVGRRCRKARFRELGYVASNATYLQHHLYVKGQVQERGKMLALIVSDPVIKHPERVDLASSLTNISLKSLTNTLFHVNLLSHTYWYHICSYKHKVLKTLSNI